MFVFLSHCELLLSFGYLGIQCRARHLSEFSSGYWIKQLKGLRWRWCRLDSWDSDAGAWPWSQRSALMCVRCVCYRLLERHRVRTQALLSPLHKAAQRGHQVVQRHSECDRHQGPHRHTHPAADSGHQGRVDPSPRGGSESLPGCHL